MLVMSWNDFYHPARKYADYIDERNKDLVSSMVYVTYTEQQVNEGEEE